MNVEHIVETQAYTVSDLLQAIVSNAGLFFGVSVVSFFEIAIQLGSHICVRTEKLSMLMFFFCKFWYLCLKWKLKIRNVREKNRRAVHNSYGMIYFSYRIGLCDKCACSIC